MSQRHPFHTNLLNRRKELGLTQEQLASRLNVSAQAVSKWERSNFPDTALLPMLAQALNISLDALFGIKTESAEPDLEQLISDAIRAVSEEKRSALFMRLIYAALCACNPGFNATAQLRGDYDKETFANLKSNYDLAFARLNSDLRYFCYLEIPQDGINGYFDDTLNMRRLFRTLADEYAFPVISYIGSETRNKMFSVAVIAEKREIPEERVQWVIDRLDRLGLVWRVSADVGTGATVLYSYTHKTPFTILLVLAKSITNYIRFCDPDIETWKRGAFRDPDKKDDAVPQIAWWDADEV